MEIKVHNTESSLKEVPWNTTSSKLAHSNIKIQTDRKLHSTVNRVNKKGIQKKKEIFLLVGVRADYVNRVAVLLR